MMTYEEAFEYAEYAKGGICYNVSCRRRPEDCSECTLDEWIGIVKAAIYQQIPKKPTIYGVEGVFNEDCEFLRWSCPACGAVTLSEYTPNRKHRAFCSECGKKILWEEENKE